MISFRYREKGSAFHHLNPLSKLAWGIGILVVSLLFSHPFYLLLLLLVTLPPVFAARIGREWASVMKVGLCFCAGIVLINALVSHHGSHVLVEFPFPLPVLGTPVITLEAIIYGLAMSLRLLVIISVFTLFTLTIHPDDLMTVLLKLKAPYKSVLVTSLATKFVPCLIEDFKRISDVHRSRGLEMDRGTWFRRIMNRSAIIIPLLSNSLDRAVQVAEAMESRAFGVRGGRTYYRRLPVTRMDVLTLALCISALGLGVAMYIWDYGDYQFYPTLGAVNMGWLEWLLLFALIIALASLVPLSLAKRVVDLD